MNQSTEDRMETVAVKERPILFSAEMVRAILDGKKTQTRRVVKRRMFDKDGDNDAGETGWCTVHPLSGWTAEQVAREYPCRYGRSGDRLWVRETWQYVDWTDDGYPFVRYRAGGATALHETIPAPASDSVADTWVDLSEPSNYAIDNKAADRRWRPSIFMPRWASRITLDLTKVRVQRVQEISEEDAIAEGFQPSIMGHGYPEFRTDARTKFRAVWDSLNAKRGYGWDANPWVRALTFKRVEVPA